MVILTSIGSSVRLSLPSAATLASFASVLRRFSIVPWIMATTCGFAVFAYSSILLFFCGRTPAVGVYTKNAAVSPPISTLVATTIAWPCRLSVTLLSIGYRTPAVSSVSVGMLAAATTPIIVGTRMAPKRTAFIRSGVYVAVKSCFELGKVLVVIHRIWPPNPRLGPGHAHERGQVLESSYLFSLSPSNPLHSLQQPPLYCLWFFLHFLFFAPSWICSQLYSEKWRP